MKTLLLASILSVALCGAATAQDLNLDRSGPYVGGSVGTSVNNSQRVDLGARAGWQIGPHVRGELDFDNTRSSAAVNALTANVQLGYRVPTTVITPYALVGTGIEWHGSTRAAVWQAGAGVRFGLAKNVELDARYAHTGPFSLSEVFPSKGRDSFTLGVNYRF